MEDSQGQLGDWSIGKQLCTGGFSKVYLATNSKTMVKAVAKVFEKKTRSLPSEIKREADILASITHPNVVQFIEFSEMTRLYSSNGKYRYETVIFTEYVPEGDFHDFLKEFGPLPEDLARTYFQQIIQIVEFLHSINLYHRDLKPENFVLPSDFTLKICDFGSASFAKDDGQFEGFVGTDAYLAPEFRLRKPFDGSSLDLFACGVILFVMTFGYRPFQDALAEDDFYSLISRDLQQEFWEKHAENSEYPKSLRPSTELKDLIFSLLAEDPKKRLGLAGVKAHEWFKKPATKLTEIKQRLHELNIEKFQSFQSQFE